MILQSFYYYTAFDLVCTDYQKDIVYKPELSGSSAFLIHSKGGQILFDAGYDHHGEYVLKKISGASLETGHKAEFAHNGQTVNGQCTFRGDKVLIRHNNDLYYGSWL